MKYYALVNLEDNAVAYKKGDEYTGSNAKSLHASGVLESDQDREDAAAERKRVLEAKQAALDAALEKEYAAEQARKAARANEVKVEPKPVVQASAQAKKK